MKKLKEIISVILILPLILVIIPLMLPLILLIIPVVILTIPVAIIKLIIDGDAITVNTNVMEKKI